MKLLKKIHRNKEDIDFKAIWSEGIFIFDSNVLLDLYRLPISAREDLFSVFQNEKFKDRIWIGFQVLLEFLNNRLEVISDQKNKFNQVKTLVDSTISEYEDSFSKLERELKKLKLAQRHSLIETEEHINQTNIRQGKNFLNEFISYLNELEKEQFDVNENDIIKDKVLDIFNNKVGESFDKKTLENIFKEGEERFKNNVPPGFLDSKKEGSYPYEDKKIVRKFGDLLLWKEIIEKCKLDNLRFAVLVTGDVKEDWWQKKRGMKLGARIELLNEIYTEAPLLDTFHMYDTSSFLMHAKQEIDNNIKESSITETKELIELSKTERINSGKNILFDKAVKFSKLKETQKKIDTLKTKLAENETYLKTLSKYIAKIYNESEFGDEIWEYAHNLGLSKAEFQEECSELNEKIKELENKKEKLTDRNDE